MQKKYNSQFQDQFEKNNKKDGETYVDYIPENQDKENNEDFGEYVDFEELE